MWLFVLVGLVPSSAWCHVCTPGVCVTAVIAETRTALGTGRSLGNHLLLSAVFSVRSGHRRNSRLCFRALSFSSAWIFPRTEPAVAHQTCQGPGRWPSPLCQLPRWACYGPCFSESSRNHLQFVLLSSQRDLLKMQLRGECYVTAG